MLGLVGGAPGGETPRVADSSAAGAGRFFHKSVPPSKQNCFHTSILTVYLAACKTLGRSRAVRLLLLPHRTSIRIYQSEGQYKNNFLVGCRSLEHRKRQLWTVHLLLRLPREHGKAAKAQQHGSPIECQRPRQRFGRRTKEKKEKTQKTQKKIKR